MSIQSGVSSLFNQAAIEAGVAKDIALKKEYVKSERQANIYNQVLENKYNKIINNPNITADAFKEKVLDKSDKYYQDTLKRIGEKDYDPSKSYIHDQFVLKQRAAQEDVYKELLDRENKAKANVNARAMTLANQKENTNKIKNILDTSLGKIDINSALGKRILAEMDKQGGNNGK